MFGLKLNFSAIPTVLFLVIFSFSGTANGFSSSNSRSFSFLKKDFFRFRCPPNNGKLFMSPPTTTMKHTMPSLRIIQPTWLFNNKTLFDPLAVKEIFTNPNVSKDWNTIDTLAGDILIMKDKEKLELPLISLNSSKVAEDLYDCFKKGPDERTKPLFYLMKTMGGGKTRLLCETWKDLLSKLDVFPIAITFNCQTPWSGSYNCELESPVEDGMLYKQMTKNCELATMMSVAGRMIHSLVGGKFSNIFDFFVKYSLGFDPNNKNDKEWKQFREMDPSDRHTFFSEKISKETFFNHFCGDVNAIINYHRPHGCQSKGIILLIDESIKGIENMGVEKDPYRLVRVGILDKCAYEGNPFKGCLAMTGLGVSGIDESDSERKIALLESPDVLDVGELIDKWFGFLNWSKKQLYSLRLWLSCFNGNPRALEIFRRSLKSDDTANAIGNSSNFQIDLYNLVNSVQKKYHEFGYCFDFPTPDEFYDVLYDSDIEINKSNVHRLLIKGILTNALLGSTVNVHPSTSLMTLKSCIQYFSGRIKNHFAYDLSNTMLEVFQRMESVLMRPYSAEGELLDVLFEELLFTKLSIIPYLNDDVDLATLVGNNNANRNVNGVNYNDIGIFVAPIQVKNKFFRLSSTDQLDFGEWLDGRRLKVSSNNCDFWKLLSEIGNGMKNPVILSSKNSDRFDVVMKFWTKNSDSPFYWFVDLKSAQENDRTNPSIFRAYKHINQPICVLESWRKHASQYIHEDNIHFSFMSSHVSSIGNETIANALKNNSFPNTAVSVINRKSVMKFLGPFGNVYRAMRHDITLQK